MNGQEWDSISGQLERLYDAVYLRCDGYVVSAWMGRISRNRLAIQVWVNGAIKVKWLRQGDAMSDEARRFFRPSTRALHSKKVIKSVEKLLGKRWCKENGYYKKFVWREPYWNSPRTFIRHLIKPNEHIEIIDREQHDAAIEKYTQSRSREDPHRQETAGNGR